MAYSTKETQNLEFWRERLKTSPTPLEAIGQGFNWPLIDSIHKKIISEYVKEGDDILDVACGIGRTADWFKGGRYVGIDFVPEFIEIAKKTNPDRVFEVCDITKKLHWQDGYFDAAVLISVKNVIAPVIGMEKWEEVEKELMRVAKTVIILEYGNSIPAEIYKSTEVF